MISISFLSLMISFLYHFIINDITCIISISFLIISDKRIQKKLINMIIIIIIINNFAYITATRFKTLSGKLIAAYPDTL